MKNEKSPTEQPVSVPPSNGNPVPVPTKDQVLEWVKKDLHAAHYFLGLLLQYPEVIEVAAEQMYSHVMAKEKGAAIDQIKHD